jgi:hydroxypyruvate isomerase
MGNQQNRRSAIKNILAGTAAVTASGMISSFTTPADDNKGFGPLKGNINHSVSPWCQKK